MSDPTDIQPIPAGVALPEIARMLTDIGNAALNPTNDSRVTQFRILETMLETATEEDLFKAQEAGTVASKDFTEIPFRLQAEDVQWFASSPAYVEQGAFPFYALLTVTTIERGERVVVNAGGLSTIGILRKLLEWENDPNRPADQKPFAPYADEGGKPLQFVTRSTGAGWDVVLLKPVVTVQTNAKRATTRKGN
jgi:hypothetical protein